MQTPFACLLLRNPCQQWYLYGLMALCQLNNRLGNLNYHVQASKQTYHRWY
jgi:hypothetical protein